MSVGYLTSGTPYVASYANGTPSNGYTGYTDDVRRLQVGTLNIYNPSAAYFAGNRGAI
jgi:hypothetical protein